MLLAAKINLKLEKKISVITSIKYEVLSEKPETHSSFKFDMLYDKIKYGYREAKTEYIQSHQRNLRFNLNLSKEKHIASSK